MSWSLLEQEVATIEHLDFPAGCQHRTCDREARWTARCRECSRTVLYCTPHRQAFEWRLVGGQSDAHQFVSCPDCDAEVPVARWRDLIEFLPLGGT